MNQSGEPTTAQLFDLTGKVALVTGAAGFLGTTFSRALAEAGATVVATSRDLSRAEAVATQLPGPATHWAVSIDQLDEASIGSGFAEAVRLAGKVDILINNAHDLLVDDLTTVTAEQFNRQMANATGYFLLARLLRDHAVGRREPASIVMLGSMYGVVGSYPDTYEGIRPASSVAYHALKGGVIHMTRHLAVFWAKDNIRVNCLSPGAFPSDKAPAEMVERLRPKTPMGRMGRPHELKGALLLLASDAGSYMTGQNILVDGGWTAW